MENIGYKISLKNCHKKELTAGPGKGTILMCLCQLLRDSTKRWFSKVMSCGTGPISLPTLTTSFCPCLNTTIMFSVSLLKRNSLFSGFLRHCCLVIPRRSKISPFSIMTAPLLEDVKIWMQNSSRLTEPS